ncbi:MAG: hypothetical protein GY835_04920 [bacterium]|nr:hypothetical protein [bacterium]
MSEQRRGGPGRIEEKSGRLKRLLLLVLVFLSGAVCMHVADLISRKAELMGHPYKLVRLMDLAGVVQHGIGLDHFYSCESKVHRLHKILASTAQADRVKEDEVAAVIASILIDGRNCNEYLVQHLDCHQELPCINPFDDFRSVFIFDMDFAPLLKDEQGLILFLLHRINPEALLFSPEYFYGCEQTIEEGRRAFLVYEWNYLYGEDAPLGIFERLFKKLFN